MATYPFTQDQAQEAYDQWGCNCGPAALAFALQSSLDHAHALIPGFDDKKYTSPSMMSHAVTMAKRAFDSMPTSVPEGNDLSPMFSTRFSLVRIQWTGPWTAPGANPKWAYRQTHWIATWEDFTLPMVFKPIDDPLPLLKGGGLDWSGVRSVEVWRIGDYH